MDDGFPIVLLNPNGRKIQGTILASWIPPDPLPTLRVKSILPGWSVDRPTPKGIAQRLAITWPEPDPLPARRRLSAPVGSSFPFLRKPNVTLSSIISTWWVPADPLPTLQGKHAGIAWRYYNLTVASAFALTHSILVAWLESRSSDLALIGRLTDSIATGSASSAAFTQTIVDRMVYTDRVSSSLALTQGAAGWVSRHASGGGSNSDCNSEYLSQAPISLQSTVTFNYQALSVTIRAPEFGNATVLDVGTIVRKNRGGEFKISKPSAWPVVEILKMSFMDLSAAKKDALVDFLSQSAGYQIQFIDHENITWDGVIITPVVDVIKAVGLCSNQIDLEFRGVRS